MHDEPIILVGGSKINSHLLKKIYKKHKIYAADSGANFLLSNEMDFEAVIGDMDSIDSQKLSYIKNEKKNFDFRSKYYRPTKMSFKNKFKNFYWFWFY